MENLCAFWVREGGFQAGGLKGALGKMNQMDIPFCIRNLNHAQTIPQGIQAHGFCINSQIAFQDHRFG
jgi:hypothetical protein